MTDHQNYFATHDHTEGYFQVEDYELYYRKFGSGDNVLLGLHGGPGMPHDYLSPLAQHAGEDYTVYLYDQFGVGRSDTPAPGDFDRFRVNHYRDEVEAVRQAIDPEGSFSIYGQSWGGMLAQEYLLEYGNRVDSLILANTLADTQTAYESMRSVLTELSESDQAVIEQHENQRTYDDAEYEAVLDTVYREHLCRTDEYPQQVLATLERINLDIYGLMWGPNEYVLMDTARLRDWDVRNQIDSISIPTIVISGEYDEIEPSIARDLANRIPNSELYVFEQSSHMPFWEEPDAHYDVVESFLHT